MKQEIKTTDIALITTEAVLKTFGNENAYLNSVIEPVKDDPIKRVRTYKVRTDLAVYRPVEVGVLDTNGTPTFETDGTAITETKQQLTNVEQKQDWSIQVITYAEIDAFAAAVQSSIPDGLTKTETELLELGLVFLMERKKNAPWGIAADKWRLRTDADLLMNNI